MRLIYILSLLVRIGMSNGVVGWVLYLCVVRINQSYSNILRNTLSIDNDHTFTPECNLTRLRPRQSVGRCRRGGVVIYTLVLTLEYRYSILL